MVDKDKGPETIGIDEAVFTQARELVKKAIAHEGRPIPFSRQDLEMPPSPTALNIVYVNYQQNLQQWAGEGVLPGEARALAETEATLQAAADISNGELEV